MSESAQTGQEQALERVNEAVLPAEFSFLIEELPALVAYMDCELHYVYVNRAFEQFFDVPGTGIVGRELKDVTNAEHYSVAGPYLRRALEGEHVSFASSLRRADGLLRDVEVAYGPRFHDKKVVGLIALTRDVTDRTFMAEARLRLAAIVDSSDDAIVSKTFEGVVTSWNRSAERMFGYTAAEAVGQHITLIIPPERRGEEEQVLARLRRGEKVDHFETERRAKDGRTVYVSLTVSPIRNAQGELIGASKVARDITQRRRDEEALRASEAQFRTLANSIPNLAWMAHPNGSVFWFNSRWYEYTQKLPEDEHGWDWKALTQPELVPVIVEKWSHSLATGEPFEMTFPIKGADGRFRSFLTRGEPIKDSDGRVIRWFGTNTDVTTQQEAELREKRARATAEILNRVGPVVSAELDLERLTQKITDIATEAVRADFGALFHTARNEEGEALVLYTLSGAPREAFASFPLPRNTQVFGPTFEGLGPIRSDDITRDLRYGKNHPYRGMPAGHLPVRSYLAVPVKSRTGKVLGGLFFGHSDAGVFGEEAEAIAVGIAGQAAIALDNASLFEEAKRSGEALLKSNTNLKRLNEDLNQFAYSASHDLREPLRMVSIYTQFISRRLAGRLNAEEEKYMQYILNGTERLESLIRDLLAYTQAAESSDSEPPITDAGQAMERALYNLTTALEEAGAAVTRSELPSVRIAEVHFVQLMQNLVGNAIKYRSEAFPVIKVGAVRRHNIWEFFVSDNGIGIEEQYREQIFGIFKRLHRTDQYSGTGIGLAICQRIVERAGGRIWVESEAGRGSTFFFTLPAAD
jgi:PAS domain S-box-containing protein